MIIELQNKNAELNIDNSSLRSELINVNETNKKYQKDLIDLSRRLIQLKEDYNELFNILYKEK
jgi:regulator of replication initiation timing